MDRCWRACRPVRLAGLFALLVVLGLEGCASALRPISAMPPAPYCGLDGKNCLSQGRTEFEVYRRAKIAEIISKSGGYRLPSAPIAFIHSARTKYSILLIHGLNDSAYYMADLAEALYHKGFNVITVLLPGHGTATQDMSEVSAEQWRTEVEMGLRMSSLAGEKTILGGFSLGASLALDALSRHREISGLLLFSPALRLRYYDSISSSACIPVLRSYLMKTDLPPNPVKYKYRLGNGLCQLSRLMEHNIQEGKTEAGWYASASEKLQVLAHKVTVPTFLALSYADQRISPKAALDFAGSIAAPVLVTTFGKSEDPVNPVLANGGKIVPITDVGLPHSYLLRRTNPYNAQENPCFDRLVEVLGGFLRQYLLAGTRPAETTYPDCGIMPKTLGGGD